MTPRIHDGIALRTAARLGAAAAAAILLFAALFNQKAAAAGWLIGFVFWAQILSGSLVLIMIHRLTSGRWGEIIAPAVEPAAAAVPLLIVLAIPLFISIPTLYPWPHHSDAIRSDVLSHYLNTPAFIVRSLIALIAWTGLAWLLPRHGGRRGQLAAAIGLGIYALTVSLVSIDWFLSLEAPFTSSSFGASVAISSLVAALAAAAVIMPAAENDPAVGDVGGLLLATVLGITYVDFMAVLVIWYGDLPREEIWFVERDQLPWSALAVAAFALVSLIPILALLLSRVRNAREPLRAVGACVLAGLAIYNAYLIAPSAGGTALATGLIAVVGIGLGLFGATASAASMSSREPANAR